MQIFSAFFLSVEFQPREIVQRHLVKFCKPDEMVHGHFALAGLIELILLTCDAEDLGKLLLREIAVLSQVTNSLIKKHTKILRNFMDYVDFIMNSFECT